MPDDEFQRLRVRILRRAVYGLNAAALLEGRVPAEGPFDAAVANALAAIIGHEHPGKEYATNGRVRAPIALLTIVTKSAIVGEPWVEWIDTNALREGVELSQPYRHGRADDEWTHIGERHVAALVALDSHEALRVLDQAEGRTFAQLVVELYADEVDERLGFDPKERLDSLDPDTCPDCGRLTLLFDGFDDWGVGPGTGRCIACGHQRTGEDAVLDGVRRAVDRPD